MSRTKRVAPPVGKHERRRDHISHGRADMIKIQEIRQKELTSSEQTVLTADSERWQRMGAGAHLDDWLAYGEGLMIRRRLAMKIAYTNKPEGKGYVTAFKQLMECDGLHTMD